MYIQNITTLGFRSPKDSNLRFQGHSAEHPHRRFSEAQAAALATMALRQDGSSTPLLDHDKPRGYAQVPVYIERAGSKIANTLVYLDFLPYTLKRGIGGLFNGASRVLGRGDSIQANGQTDPLEGPRQVQALLASVERRQPLGELYDIEEGVRPDETHRLLTKALQDEPQLMAVVEHALTPPLLAVLKWPMTAQPRLAGVLKEIIRWQQTRESYSPSTLSPVPLAVNGDGPAQVSSALPEERGHSSSQASPVDSLEGASDSLANLPQENSRQLAFRLQAHAALSDRGARAIADALRQSKLFQKRPLSEAELQSRYFLRNQNPPLQHPHQFMVLDPEPSSVRVSHRLGEGGEQSSPATPTGWRRWLPHPRKVVLDQPLPVKVTARSPNAQLLVAALLKNQELPFAIEPNTTVALRVRNEKAFKEKVFRPIVDTFRISDEIEIKDPANPGQLRKVQLKEACLWPFIEAVLLQGEAGLGANCKIKGTGQNCFDLLADADIYQFTASDARLARWLNHRLHHSGDANLRTLKAKLAAIQLAGLQYAEQVDVLDTVTTFSKGFAAGVAGEQIASHIGGEAIPGENVWKNPAMWIRLAFLSLVDTIDNWYGEHGVLEADLKGMGLRNNREDVFGSTPPSEPVPWRHYFSARHATGLPKWLESFRRRVLLVGAGDADGKASQSVATTYRSVALGGLGGMAASLYAAKTFTEAEPQLHEQVLSTSIGTLGAFSIPINFGLTLPRVMSSFNEHLEAGRLKLPGHISPNDEKAVRAYVKEVAMQEMMSRTGLQSSLKSYTVIPALGLVWPAQLVIPRHILQSVLATFMPVAENLTRMGMMLHRVERVFPQSLSDVEGMVLAAFINDESDLRRYQSPIRSAFNGPWSRLAAQGMNVLTYPLQLAMTHRKHIDFHDGPEDA